MYPKWDKTTKDHWRHFMPGTQLQAISPYMFLAGFISGHLGTRDVKLVLACRENSFPAAGLNRSAGRTGPLGASVLKTHTSHPRTT